MKSSTAIANARSNWGSTDNDATVLVGATVAVVVGATVVAGVAVSELPLHPETTNKNVRATAYLFTA